jgi:hypothetical protein
MGARVVRETLRALPEGRGLADRAAARIASDVRERLDLDETDAAMVRDEFAASAGRIRTVREEAFARIEAELLESTRTIVLRLPEEEREAFLEVVAPRFERLGFAPPTLEAVSNR